MMRVIGRNTGTDIRTKNGHKENKSAEDIKDDAPKSLQIDKLEIMPRQLPVNALHNGINSSR